MNCLGEWPEIKRFGIVVLWLALDRCNRFIGMVMKWFYVALQHGSTMFGFGYTASDLLCL